MSWFLTPLSSTPQTFQIQLAGVNYQMTLKWCDSDEGGWQMDISNSDTNTPLAFGVPLITGADCLSGLEYLGIGGSLWVYTNGNSDAVPTYTNLGVESNLYFVTSS